MVRDPQVTLNSTENVSLHNPTENLLLGHSEESLGRVDVAIVNLVRHLVPGPGTLPHLDKLMSKASDILTHLSSLLEFLVQGSATGFHITVFGFAGGTAMIPIMKSIQGKQQFSSNNMMHIWSQKCFISKNSRDVKQININHVIVTT